MEKAKKEIIQCTIISIILLVFGSIMHLDSSNPFVMIGFVLLATTVYMTYQMIYSWSVGNSKIRIIAAKYD
jgi:CO dehydrogenase/acetyl-CoA synthase gamma subunit (corrinoid Fe-S protein)